MSVLKERRQFKRFNISMVIEFKPLLSEQDLPFLGMTRNLSSGGLSFESRDFDFNPGESLKFKFRHPEKNSYVSDTGCIVWKRHENKFSSSVGIAFKEKEAWKALSGLRNVRKKLSQSLIKAYSLIAIIVLVAFFIIFKDFNKDAQSPLPVVSELQVTPDIDIIQPVKVPDQVPDIETSYIQVGAWKNSEYAEDILRQIKKYYPAVYVKVENNFNKIRIPGVKNEEEGAIIMKDIEERFNLKSFMVNKAR